MSLHDLLAEDDRSLACTEHLWRDLTVEEIPWRPSSDASAIGWHLGHLPAVAHVMIRNSRHVGFERALGPGHVHTRRSRRGRLRWATMADPERAPASPRASPPAGQHTGDG